MMARLTVDVRLTFDDEVPESIEVLRFIDQEARRLNASGRAGYILQLATAAYLARKGDMTLAGMLMPQAVGLTPQPEQQQQSGDANTDAVDNALEGLF